MPKASRYHSDTPIHRHSDTSFTAGYLAQTERPWAALVFLFPLVVVYELYALGWLTGPGGSPVHRGQHITAFLLTEEFLALFGATGRHLPAFVLVAMLLGAHVCRRDSWHLRSTHLVGMAIESAVWAAPLFILGWIIMRCLPPGVAATPLLAPVDNRTMHALALSVGAGLYEELVFRLLGVTILLTLLRDGLGLSGRASFVGAVGLSAIAFSLYHYIGWNQLPAAGPMLFRTLAGGFFGTLFLLRGFGVTAGSHAVYDAVVLTILAR